MGKKEMGVYIKNLNVRMEKMENVIYYKKKKLVKKR
jgi:hypothetical protein